MILSPFLFLKKKMFMIITICVGKGWYEFGLVVKTG